MASTALSMDSAVRLSPSQVSADLGAELTVLNISSRVYYGLEDLGARIWAMLREPVRLAAVRDRIVEEYEVEPGRAAADLVRFIASLVDAGLAEVVEDPSGPVVTA